MKIIHKIQNILLGAGVLLVAAIFILFLKNNQIHVNFNDHEIIKLSSGWYTLDEEEKTQVEIPNDKLTKNPVTTIYYDIEDDTLDGKALMFRSSQQKVIVKVDSETIYQFGYEKQPWNISVGSAWNLVRLPAKMSGKTVSIRLESDFPSYYGVVNEITAGSKIAQVYEIMTNYGASCLVSLCILIAGIVLITMSLVFRKIPNTTKSTFWLGWFSVIIGMWMTIESRMLQILFDNQLLVNTFVFILIAIAPIALLRFLYHSNMIQFKRALPIMEIVFEINLFMIVILQATNRLLLYRSLRITHILVGIATALAVMILVREFVLYHERSIMYFFVATLFLIIFMIPEFVIFYYKVSGITGNFMRVGVSIFIFILAADSCEKMIAAVKDAKSLKYFKNIAYLDLMTKCKNRTAYINKMDELKEQQPASVGIVVADVDNLKKINDMCGHETGDDAITRVAVQLKKVFENKGECFRTGGDEFVCIVKDTNIEELEKKKNQLARLIQKENEKVTYNLSISIGAALQHNSSGSINEAYMEADMKMYEQKKKKKSCSHLH